MKKLTAHELHSMTKKAIQEWIDGNACEINRTMVMSWSHDTLFKNLHVKPDMIGYRAGRIMVKGFSFSTKARKADMVEFAEWLHWAISGEYPTEETETTEAPAETEQATEEATPATTAAPTDAAELDNLKAIRDDITTDPNPDTIRAAQDAINRHFVEIDPEDIDTPRKIRAALTDIINAIYWDIAEDITPATTATEAAEEHATTAHPVPAKLAREYDARTYTNRDKWQRCRLPEWGGLCNSISWRYYHGAGTPRT